MELRTLKYFIALVREGNISNAAKALHVTQPTLSRQLLALEQELGTQLYTRGHKSISLTEQGNVLYRYALSITELAEKCQEEISLPENTVTGSVHIGVGETKLVALLARAMKRTQQRYPGIVFELNSGNSADLMDRLNKGFYDFLLECEVQAHVNLNTLVLPIRDEWGLIIRADSPLAALRTVTPADFVKVPIIMSQQGVGSAHMKDWLGEHYDSMQVSATYNLPHVGKFLVREGLGAMMTYSGLFDERRSDDLRFVPMEPLIESKQGIVWRKVTPTKPAQAFLIELQQLCHEIESGRKMIF